ncbi:MAG: quinone-dependent dihydroorotate dehydrogenase [Deltaproteobacteria bacterium]
MLYRALRPLLFLLPAEVAHRLGLSLVRWLGRWPWLRRKARARSARPMAELRCERFGLAFDNPIGLAAGLDKDGTAVGGLFALGFGFIEVGTLTPRPQPGNPAPRLFRIPSELALVNRMGFNNRGVAACRSALARAWRPGPLGINVGKNKATPDEEAASDYEAAARAIGPAADYAVVNVSSPNTPGLRRLQDIERMSPLLRRVRGALDERPGRRVPLLVKVAPDLEDRELEAIVDLAVVERLDGIVATNTTVARPAGSDGRFAEAGGLSGRPLAARAAACARVAIARAAGRLVVVSVGGILTPEDAFDRLSSGAGLIQVYTGFIYGGPAFARRLSEGIGHRMRAIGVRNLDELADWGRGRRL